MKDQALAIDMVNGGRSLVRLLKLASLLEEPDLPRLRVIVPIGKLAGLW